MAHVREVCHSAHEIVCDCGEVPVGNVPLHAELPEFCNVVSQENFEQNSNFIYLPDNWCYGWVVAVIHSGK